MISSIFGKTKPINFIILLGFLFFFYWCVQYYLLHKDLEAPQVLVGMLVCGILLFSVFVVDFVVKRNKLTGTNSYAMLFFTLLVVVFPETLSDTNTILCTFFLLLATRRLLSIKSLKNSKLKIFDATLWIMISSLFYDWAVLYIILVLAAIYIYDPKNIRNWLVIFSGIFCFFLLLFGMLILIGRVDFFEAHYTFSIDLEAIYPPKWWSSIKLTLYVLANILLAFAAFLRLGKSGVGKIVTMRLIALSFAIGLAVNILVATDTTLAIMVTFFPSVIFVTNYIESIKKQNLLEVILILSIFLPIVVFVSKLMIS
nr:DUF6427 family protein [Maribacter aestuarii]